jgi:hypothetical protein
MQKTAINATALQTALRTLTGAGLGGAFGYYATPHMFGYQEVPEARRSAATIDAMLGGVAAYLGPKNMSKLMQSPPKITAENIWPTLARKTAPVTAFMAGETIPIGQAAIHKGREAAQDISGAAGQIAHSTVSGSLQRLLTSNTGRGAGVGAAGAGLAAILSGLGRRQTNEEQLGHTSRGTMVSKDFLKYLIPAILAGGIAGSFVPEK